MVRKIKSIDRLSKSDHGIERPKLKSPSASLQRKKEEKITSTSPIMSIGREPKLTTTPTSSIQIKEKRKRTIKVTPIVDHLSKSEQSKVEAAATSVISKRSERRKTSTSSLRKTKS